MWGYIVNFYKYATFPSSLKQDMNQYLNGIASQAGQSTSFLVYGEYDRLSIEMINSFSRFRDVDPYTQRWLGPRQSLLLYRLPDNGNAAGTDAGGVDLLEKFCFSQAVKDVRTSTLDSYRNFLVFTMVTLDPRLHKYSNFNEILNKCCSLINKQVNSGDVQLIEPEKIIYQVYGSFSSSELVIVWWTNQYVDALRLVDMLRYVSFTYMKDKKEEHLFPFISLYSIIAQDKNCPKGEWQHEKIQGNADLKFVFQDGVEDEAPLMKFLLKVLRESLESTGQDALSEIPYKGRRVTGIYDYSISMPAYLLCDPYRRIFQRNQPLHWDQDEIRKYISRTCIELYYDLDTDTSGSSRPKSQALFCQELETITKANTDALPGYIQLIHKMVYGEDKSNRSTDQTKQGPEINHKISPAEVWEIYRHEGLREVVKKFIPATDGLCDSLDLLYSDFVHNCSNLTSSAWAEDLTTQFIAIIDYIADQFYRLCMNDQDGLTLFSNIKGICEIYIQMIYHIAQSRRTIFTVPSCHLRYMGQYDMILHGYYGWVKYLLEMGYSLHYENGIQRTLIPVLTIDVIPEIRTNMYRVRRHYAEEQSISYIFSINLPLSAMTDFLRYSLALCHETAHFIIPHNRDRRNQIMGMLFVSEVIANMIITSSQERLINGDSDIAFQMAFNSVRDGLRRGFMAIIYNKLRLLYLSNFHGPIMEECKHQSEHIPTWEEYRAKLLQKIEDALLLGDNFRAAFRVLANERQVFVGTVSEVVCDQIARSSLDGITGLDEHFCKGIQNEVSNALSDLIASLKLEKLTKHVKQLAAISPEQLLYGDSYCISDAYREACQDLFMIRVFQLNIVDYLVFLDRHRHDTGQLEGSLSMAESLRISMVCDYLLTMSPAQDELPMDPTFALLRFDKMGEEYVTFFMSLPEMRTEAEKDEEACKKRIRNYFEHIRDNLSVYYEEYSFFRILLLEQLRDYDIFNDSIETRKKLEGSGINQFYTEWKLAIMENLSQSGQSNEMRELQMMRRIFANNVAMIQRFQPQETLNTLSSKLHAKES